MTADPNTASHLRALMENLEAAPAAALAPARRPLPEFPLRPSKAPAALAFALLAAAGRPFPVDALLPQGFREAMQSKPAQVDKWFEKLERR